jgi:hypothetical protein
MRRLHGRLLGWITSLILLGSWAHGAGPAFAELRPAIRPVLVYAIAALPQCGSRESMQHFISEWVEREDAEEVKKRLHKTMQERYPQASWVRSRTSDWYDKRLREIVVVRVLRRGQDGCETATISVCTSMTEGQAARDALKIIGKNRYEVWVCHYFPRVVQAPMVFPPDKTEMTPADSGNIGKATIRPHQPGILGPNAEKKKN